MAKEIAQIESLCIENPWSLKAFEEQLNLQHVFYLAAFHQDKMVGFLGAQIALDSADITNVAVLKEYRKQMIGTQLVYRMKKELVNMGVIEIYLEVRSSNIAARTLYQKAGFIEIGIRKNYYNHPKEDALIMQCKKLECGE